MFTKLRKRKTKLDIEIESKLDELRDADQSQKYDPILVQLDKLYKMQELQNSNRVSADTWALIGANLLGIVIIITHEYTNPVTTKAMQFAIKPK
jgi:hypothetical protein